MNILQRAVAPTPFFFKVLRSIGLSMLAVSGSLLTAQVALPAVIVTAAGYVALAGGIISAVSQLTVDDKALSERSNTAGNEQ